MIDFLKISSDSAFIKIGKKNDDFDSKSENENIFREHTNFLNEIVWISNIRAVQMCATLVDPNQSCNMNIHL